MKLVITDNYYEDNYTIEISPKVTEKVDTLVSKHEFIFDDLNEEIITINLKNYFFKKGLLGLLSNIIAVLAALYSGSKLGGPFDLIMSIKILSDNEVHVKTQSYENEAPFEVIKGDCKILENRFITNKEYKDIWIKYTIIPLVSSILIICLFIGYILFKINIIIFCIYSIINIFFSVKFSNYIRNMINF